MLRQRDALAGYSLKIVRKHPRKVWSGGAEMRRILTFSYGHIATNTQANSRTALRTRSAFQASGFLGSQQPMYPSFLNFSYTTLCIWAMTNLPVAMQSGFGTDHTVCNCRRLQKYRHNASLAYNYNFVEKMLLMTPSSRFIHSPSQFIDLLLLPLSSTSGLDTKK